MRASLSSSLSHQGSLPSPSLRRICRRQSSAAYASTHVTSPLGKIRDTTRHGYLCQKRVTPNARHPRALAAQAADRPEAHRAERKLTPKGRRAGHPTVRAHPEPSPCRREHCAHRIPPGRSPEGVLAEGSCPAGNAVRDNSGFQGAEPLERGGAGGVRYNTPCPPEA